MYAERQSEEASWFQPRPETSLELIEATGVGAECRLIDVGGGTSLLVDHLLRRGFEDVTVLDISSLALEECRRRLAGAAERVSWIEADITHASLNGPYDLWHDRAVFHFLVEDTDRARYVERLRTNLAGGGYAVIATFAPDGPQKCSGLPVLRYGADGLERELGEGFELRMVRREIHLTPAGKPQSFMYCLFRKGA